jgi:hypothetical protein
MPVVTLGGSNLKYYLRSRERSTLLSERLENPLERSDDLLTLHLGALELEIEREVTSLRVEPKHEVLRAAAPAARFSLAAQAPSVDAGGPFTPQALDESRHFVVVALSNYL